MRIGINEKILLPVVGLFLLAVGGIGALALRQAGALFQDASVRALEQDTRNAAAHVDDWFSDRMYEIEALASQDYVVSALADPAARRSAGEQFAKIVGKFPYGQALALLDGNGVVIASSDPVRLGRDYADRPYFQQSMAGKTVVSEPFLSKTSGRPVVAVSAPVPGIAGRPGGVLYFNVGLDRFAQQFLSSFEIDSFSYAFAYLPTSGRIIAHPDTSLIFGKPLDSLEIGAAMRHAELDKPEPLTLGGRHALVEEADIGQAGWKLGVVHDLESENARLAATRWTLIALSLAAAVLASLAAMFWIVRPMVRSLKEAIQFAEAVGAGDVSRTLQTRSNDEIGDLVRTLSSMGESLRRKEATIEQVAGRDLSIDVEPDSPRDALGHSMRRMVHNLRDVLGQAGKGSRDSARTADEFQHLSVELAETAEQTSSRSKALANAVEQTHGNVQAVAAGTEQMSASIREIAHSASQATTVASDALEKALRTNELVGRLGDASAQIGSMVDVIRGIAEQTNLLALNATIEAARAGEAGKGFAVVAGEVKELSKATREATEDISTRIQSIQAEMGQAVASIQGIADVIQTVNNLSQSIAAAVEEQTAATSEISRSIAEASHRVGEISDSIHQTTNAAERTSRSASEIRAASEELKLQATTVASSVNAFRLA